MSPCNTRQARAHVPWTSGEALREGKTEMSVDTSNGHPAMDYNQHKDTYNAFLRFSKIGIVLLVLLLAGMYVFLV